MKKGKQGTSRRNVVKILGLSVAAIATGGFGNLVRGNGFRSVFQDAKGKIGPDDGPNQPFGQESGIYPGRVVWAWDPKATNANCTDDYKTGDFHFKPGNYDQATVSKMFSESVKKLTGKRSVAKSWDALFKSFNQKRHQLNKGYTPGEKIFIKINQTSARGRLNAATRKEGKYYYPAYDPAPTGQRRVQASCCETTPPVVLEILRHLVNECGIKQSDIGVGDPQNPLWGHNYDAWSAEFPDIKYTDNMNGTHGRTLITPTTKDLLFFSDKSQTDKLYDIMENANYLINVPNLKPHRGAGITLTAKNHFGSQGRPRADHFHYAHPTRITGYHKYRVMVDLMGSKYLGQNTLLYVVDGLWGGGSGEVGPPVKYFMAPFNNNWCNSLFISQDQVALESVCFDFLRTEWNGINSHNPAQ